MVHKIDGINGKILADIGYGIVNMSCIEELGTEYIFRKQLAEIKVKADEKSFLEFIKFVAVSEVQRYKSEREKENTRWRPGESDKIIDILETLSDAWNGVIVSVETMENRLKEIHGEHV